MATITCTTSAVSFTEGASTVTRNRAFTGSVELVAVAENAAIVGGSKTVFCATEAISFTENAASVAIFRATIAQTFSGMTQAATGETTYSTLVGTALAQGFPRDGFTEELDGTALAGDQLYAVENQVLSDAATATDSQEEWAVAPLESTATASGGYAGGAYTHLEAHTAQAKDKITSVVVAALSSSATVTDTQQTTVDTSLRATAYASSVLTPTAIANNLLSSTATANGDPTPYFVAELAESAVASSVLIDAVFQVELLVGSLTATDELINLVATTEFLASAAIAGDTQDSSGSVVNNTLSSTATAAGVPWAKDFGAIAWTINTETNGLTSYDNYQFTSLAQLNGVVYGTTADGVYALNADDDEGRKIASAVKTGFLDFGQEETKRVSDLYLGYTGGQLECTVETYDGPQDEYTYTLEERDADAPRNNRMKVGKGLSSRYWRFTFENVQGADFQIHDMAANVGQSKRRL